MLLHQLIPPDMKTRASNNLRWLSSSYASSLGFKPSSWPAMSVIKCQFNNTEFETGTYHFALAASVNRQGSIAHCAWHKGPLSG